MKKKRKIILYLFVLAAATGLFAIWILAGRENPGLGAEDIKTQGLPARRLRGPKGIH